MPAMTIAANSSGSAQQNGTGNPAVTISVSGSTAMRNFTTSPFITLLTPGSFITLNDGAGGAGVLYTAPNVANASFQLASPDSRFQLIEEWPDIIVVLRLRDESHDFRMLGRGHVFAAVA